MSDAAQKPSGLTERIIQLGLGSRVGRFAAQYLISRWLTRPTRERIRRTPSHHQLDLNYTQNFPLRYGTNLQLRADIFNVYNRRTGYNPQPSVNSSTFGQYLNAFDPRRFQLALNVQF